jgi:hypothetical protein
VPCWLEFHDSTLRSLTQTNAAVHIVLDAYVHRWETDGQTWRGTGWEQPVRITVSKMDGRLAAPVLPAELAAGRLLVGAAIYDNLVRLPLDAAEPFNLRLELVGRGQWMPSAVGCEVRAGWRPKHRRFALLPAAPMN